MILWEVFCFVQSFEKKLKVCDFVNLLLAEDLVQSLGTVTCGVFQMYFYNNLFNPVVNSKMQNNKKLTKKKKKKNSRKVTEWTICFGPKQKWRSNTTISTRTRHNNHTMHLHDKVPTCFKTSNVSLSDIVDFGQVEI